MNSEYFVLQLLVMAGVTYFVRVVPFAFVRKQIQNRFVRRFLFYIPYSVLAAMTFPSILYSTQHLLSAGIGFLVAVIAAYYKRTLLQVAIAASLSVLIVECFLEYWIW